MMRALDAWALLCTGVSFQTELKHGGKYGQNETQTQREKLPEGANRRRRRLLLHIAAELCSDRSGRLVAVVVCLGKVSRSAVYFKVQTIFAFVPVSGHANTD